ncbi:hypothetical protein BH10PSE4_BH10PSE4_29920 [soil metagenome]
MPTVISVAPEGEAWAVLCPVLFDNVMIFKSGARAEAAARSLAEQLSQAGVDCLLQVRLRDGGLAGRFLCPAVAVPSPALSRAA